MKRPLSDLTRLIDQLEHQTHGASDATVELPIRTVENALYWLKQIGQPGRPNSRPGHFVERMIFSEGCKRVRELHASGESWPAAKEAAALELKAKWPEVFEKLSLPSLIDRMWRFNRVVR